MRKLVLLIMTIFVLPFSVYAEETKAASGEGPKVATEIPEGGFVYDPSLYPPC
jgi:hypothetical protein